MLPQDRTLQAPQMGMARRKIIHMHTIKTGNIKQLIQVSMYHSLQLLAMNILLEKQIKVIKVALWILKPSKVHKNTTEHQQKGFQLL